MLSLSLYLISLKPFPHLKAVLGSPSPGRAMETSGIQFFMTSERLTIARWTPLGSALLAVYDVGTGNFCMYPHGPSVHPRAQVQPHQHTRAEEQHLHAEHSHVFLNTRGARIDNTYPFKGVVAGSAHRRHRRRRTSPHPWTACIRQRFRLLRCLSNCGKPFGACHVQEC